MKTITIHAVVAVAMLVPAVHVLAQSPLADAARREAARRQAVRAASIPVYTNEDLDRLPARPAPARPRLPAASETTVTTAGVGGETREGPEAAAGQPAVPDAAPLPARGDEKTWRTRITTARANLARAVMFAESLQSRINALSTDVVNRDDPAQRQLLFEQREKALAELDRVQSEVAAFTREIADIEEEARRLGVPPGWLR